MLPQSHTRTTWQYHDATDCHVRSLVDAVKHCCQYRIPCHRCHLGTKPLVPLDEGVKVVFGHELLHGVAEPGDERLPHRGPCPFGGQPSTRSFKHLAYVVDINQFIYAELYDNSAAVGDAIDQTTGFKHSERFTYLCSWNVELLSDFLLAQSGAGCDHMTCNPSAQNVDYRHIAGVRIDDTPPISETDTNHSSQASEGFCVEIDR